LEEIPIRIHNSQLINALLYDMEGSDAVSAHFERLNLGFGPFLEKNLEFMADSLDELAAEQAKFQYYQKSLQRQQAQIQAYKQKKAAEGTASGNYLALEFIENRLRFLSPHSLSSHSLSSHSLSSHSLSSHSLTTFSLATFSLATFSLATFSLAHVFSRVRIFSSHILSQQAFSFRSALLRFRRLPPILTYVS
jgi:C-terminal region of eIF3h